MQVKRVAMAAMMKALGKPLAESDQGGTGTDISVGSEKPAQDEEQQDPSAEIEADGVEWFGWAASECFWQEILHLYCGVVRNRTAVVDSTPGCGLLAWRAQGSAYHMWPSASPSSQRCFVRC